MINFDDIMKESIKGNNLNQPQISDHPYRILTIRYYGSGKTNTLFNLISQQPDIDKFFLYPKDPYEAKYQLLINKCKGSGLKHFNDSKAFIDYSNDMGDCNGTRSQNHLVCKRIFNHLAKSV